MPYRFIWVSIPIFTCSIWEDVGILQLLSSNWYDTKEMCIAEAEISRRVFGLSSETPDNHMQKLVIEWTP